MKTLKEEREAITDKLSTICKQADQYQINAGYPVETPAIKIVEALLLSHEEKVVAGVREEIKSWLMNYDSKDGYSTAYDGVIEHIYDRVNTLTLPITDENV